MEQLETERSYNNKLALTKDIILEMSSKQSKSELFQYLTKTIVNIFDAEGSAVYLYDPKTEELTLVALHNLRESLLGVKVKADQGLLGQVVKRLEAMKIDDYRQWPQRINTFEEDQYRALLEAPILWNKVVIGVIGLVRTGDARPFDAFDSNLLSIIGIQVAATISNLES